MSSAAAPDSTAPHAPATVRGVAPVAGWLAALAGVVGGLPVAFFALFVGLLSAGYGEWRGVLLGAVPAVAFGLVLVGAALLVTGRSWSVLVLGAVLCLVLVGFAVAQGDLQHDPLTLVWLGGGPLLAAVLGSLPGVRSWVAARRAARG